VLSRLYPFFRQYVMFFSAKIVVICKNFRIFVRKKFGTLSDCLVADQV
jgi:hypothetical protein